MSRRRNICISSVVLRSTIFWWSVVALTDPLLAQSPAVATSPRDTISLILSAQFRDSLFRLPHNLIVGGSETMTLRSGKTLRGGIDYTLNHRAGSVRFDSSFINLLLSDSSSDRQLTISYRYLPFRFQDDYYKRKLVVLKDSTGGDSIRISRPRSSFSMDDIFGENLQKSGSIVRGFTVGSNRDLSLNSGLRLQMAGKISSDLEVVAALTDESTPIQPEGTTQTLQEFDKVFVEMRGTDFTATLGDFNLDLGGTEFARLGRKLQGAKGAADYRLGFAAGSAVVSGAVPRGKYTTNQFQGIEGVQGPYRLVGKNNERSIIVIAGTERVYINGELQTRGETNDYIIDYSIAEVTFSTRRLVTAASRITVDFEYTDRQYSRSLLAAQTSSRFFDNKATLTLSYLREADDPDAPIDFSISDSARLVLERAGNDREKAVLSGVTDVDSNGYYVRIDTLLSSGDSARFFRYSPGKLARYNVAFSNVGAGRGEYIRQSIGVFVWKGPGGGEYLPIRFLALPQLQQTMDVLLDIAPVNSLRITGELASSTFDANRFSSINDQNNSGHALNFTAGFSPKDVRIGGSNIGSFEVRLRERYVNKRFSFIDRVNDIEFNRKWGIDSVTQSNEEIQEALLRYFPVTQVGIGGGYGRIGRGSDLNSKRLDGSVNVKGEGLPSVQYSIENIRSDEPVTDNSSRWLRQKGSAEYAIQNITPMFRYESENRRSSSMSLSTMKPGSFRYSVFSSGVRARDLGPVSLATEFEWRTDNLFHEGHIARESKSFTQTYGGKLSEWHTVSSSLDITLREKKYSEAFRRLGNADVKTVLVRSQSRLTPLNHGLESDVFYEVATERSSRLERVFVRVSQGTGNYRYLGDLNNNGVAEENEFEPVRFDGDFIAITLPSDQLFPVIDLKSSLRFRFIPKQLLDRETGFPTDILSAITTESYIRVEERSTESDLKQIYLLHFSRFQDDSTTIAGSTQFTQDVNIMEASPDVSVRLRYSQRTGLNRFTSGIERNYVRDRSIRLRLQLVKEIANQIDYINRMDRVTSEQTSSRLRDILSNSIAFDLSYRPEQDIEFGLRIEQGTSTDRFQMPELRAGLNTQSLRFVYAFQGSGQLRAEASREEVRLSQVQAAFPFELTGGRVDGKTWLWRAAFDYRVTQFIQATMNYDGRSEGGRAPVHTGRAEVRAFF